MEFDQSFNATPVDWNFPSPTATPTDDTFGGSILRTPKTSTMPSHFQDALMTPQIPLYATPQPVQYHSATPIRRPQTSSETLRSNYYANINASGGQSVGRNMAPPGQMDHTFTTFSPPTLVNSQSISLQSAMNTPFDSAQMQTPPPTRGASIKKHHQQQHSQQIAFGTPSTIASRRFLTPQQAASSNDSVFSSQQFPQSQLPQLQFSPDVYQFANVGPASAPAGPQGRVLWAQNSPDQPGPMPTLDDPFAPSAKSVRWATNALQLDNGQIAHSPLPTCSGHPIVAPHPRPASAALASTTYAFGLADDQSAAVDPSLLFSSSMQSSAPSSGKRPGQRPQSAQSETPAKAAAHDSQRSSRAIHPPCSASSQAEAGLRRSNTIGGPRPMSSYHPSSGFGSLVRNDSVHQTQRSTSPAKWYGRNSLGSISEGKARLRTSVILTIDENGRARTETKRVDESPTRSIRERYPALFDDDSSDEESDGSGSTLSRAASFTFEKRDQRRSKAARLDPPIENLEGLSIPRSNSSVSMRKGVTPSRAAAVAAAQLRRQGSLRRSTPCRNSSNRRSSALIDTAPMDAAATPRQHAVGGAERERSYEHLNTSAWSAPAEEHGSVEEALAAYNQRWSMISSQQQSSMPSLSPPLQQYQDMPAFANAAAPVLPHHVYPPPVLMIRCLCGVPNDRGQPLIQCSSCTQFLHGPCVGLDRLTPPNFTCFLCIKPPTTMEHGDSASHHYG